MTSDRIIGHGLMTMGALAASLAFIQTLFQQDSSSLPFDLGLGYAVCAVVGGAVAVRIGAKISAG
jgi:hypothetical protein